MYVNDVSCRTIHDVYGIGWMKYLSLVFKWIINFLFSLLFRRFSSKVPVSKITNTRNDVELFIDTRIDSCGHYSHLGEGIGNVVHTCKTKSIPDDKPRMLEYCWQMYFKEKRDNMLLLSMHNETIRMCGGVFWKASVLLSGPKWKTSGKSTLCQKFILTLLREKIKTLHCIINWEIMYIIPLPCSVIRREHKEMCSSVTSWSSNTLIAIIAAAPVATVASIRKMW